MSEDKLVKIISTATEEVESRSEDNLYFSFSNITDNDIELNFPITDEILFYKISYRKASESQYKILNECWAKSKFKVKDLISNTKYYFLVQVFCENYSFATEAYCFSAVPKVEAEQAEVIVSYNSATLSFPAIESCREYFIQYRVSNSEDWKSENKYSTLQGKINFNLKNLTESTTYELKIFSLYTQEYSESPKIIFQTKSSVANPLNLFPKIVKYTPTSLTISFSNVEFPIYLETYLNRWDRIASITTREYTIENLQPSTRYYFRAKIDNSDWFFIEGNTKIDDSQLSAPEILFTKLTDSSFGFEIQNKNQNIENYLIQVEDCFTNKTFYSLTEEKSNLFHNLSPNTQYNVFVRAQNTDRCSYWSNYKIQTLIPMNPTYDSFNFEIKNIADTSAVVSWTNKSLSNNNFVIELFQNGLKVQTIESNIASIALQDLVPNTTYILRVTDSLKQTKEINFLTAPTTGLTIGNLIYDNETNRLGFQTSFGKFKVAIISTERLIKNVIFQTEVYSEKENQFHYVDLPKLAINKYIAIVGQEGNTITKQCSFQTDRIIEKPIITTQENVIEKITEDNIVQEAIIETIVTEEAYQAPQETITYQEEVKEEFISESVESPSQSPIDLRLFILEVQKTGLTLGWNISQEVLLEVNSLSGSILSKKISSSPYVLEGLIPGMEYHIKATVVEFPEEIEETTIFLPKVSTGNFPIIIENNDDGTLINWNKLENADIYEIELSDKGTWTSIANLPGSFTKVSLGVLDGSKTAYLLRIRAKLNDLSYTEYSYQTFEIERPLFSEPVVKIVKSYNWARISIDQPDATHFSVVIDNKKIDGVKDFIDIFALLPRNTYKGEIIGFKGKQIICHKEFYFATDSIPTKMLKEKELIELTLDTDSTTHCKVFWPGKNELCFISVLVDGQTFDRPLTNKNEDNLDLLIPGKVYTIRLYKSQVDLTTKKSFYSLAGEQTFHTQDLEVKETIETQGTYKLEGNNIKINLTQGGEIVGYHVELLQSNRRISYPSYLVTQSVFALPVNPKNSYEISIQAVYKNYLAKAKTIKK